MSFLSSLQLLLETPPEIHIPSPSSPSSPFTRPCPHWKSGLDLPYRTFLLEMSRKKNGPSKNPSPPKKTKIFSKWCLQIHVSLLKISVEKFFKFGFFYSGLAVWRDLLYIFSSKKKSAPQKNPFFHNSQGEPSWGLSFLHWSLEMIYPQLIFVKIFGTFKGTLDELFGSKPLTK